jgi:hypothetical protein
MKPAANTKPNAVSRSMRQDYVITHPTAAAPSTAPKRLPLMR